jgi:CHAT domain-containing protein
VTNRARHIFTVALLAIVLLTGRVAAENAPGAKDYLATGSAAFDRGDLDAAEQAWSAGLAASQAAGQRQETIALLGRRGELMRLKGNFRQAVLDLTEAVSLARASQDALTLSAAQASLANVYVAQRRLDEALPLFIASFATAETAGSTRLAANIANDLGNMQSELNDPRAALEWYGRALGLARSAEPSDALVDILINQARIMDRIGRSREALDDLSFAVDRIEALPASHIHSLQATAIAVLASGLTLDARDRPRATALTARMASLALDQARATGSRVALSWALGNQAAMKQKSGALDEAIALTGQALLAAQSADAPELNFRWEWQLGRLQSARNDGAAALTAYRRAARSLKSFRSDIPIQYADGRSSFRETFGQFYQEYAALLLISDQPPSDDRLAEAIQVLEETKAAELQDYFHDGCVAELRSRTQSLETVSAKAAILYPVLLKQRVGMIVSIAGKRSLSWLPVPIDQLEREVRALRALMEKRTTREFLPHAQRIYDWLIRPIEPDLTASLIDTLVIVPDSFLRIIPIAALQDGKNYLVERFAIATAPGLELVDARPLKSAAPLILAVGLTEASQEMPALPSVAQEVGDLVTAYHAKGLLDRAYSARAFEDELTKSAFSIVHLASHGVLTSDPRQSFVLTYDGRVTLDDLEEAIKFGKFRQDPLELLTISACQTAAGDDRAALGLGGIAIKAGARSALASLWAINDRATERLMKSFYKGLALDHMSKAKALQAAQRAMLTDDRYQHPSYWAAFLLIGSWL